MNTKEKADALVMKHRHYTPIIERIPFNNATNCAILSVEHTIEVLNKVIAHDKERYGITSRGATIEKDNQLNILNELKSRL